MTENPAAERHPGRPAPETLPPEIASPLSPFKGEKPPAPRWFEKALSKAPERLVVPVAGVQIEALVWGELGKPGLLLLHGNGAHADWWSFIAPFFARDYRVCALSWSGMGGSGWREKYTAPLCAEEMFAVAEATGLAASGKPPLVVAHSFGGFQALYASVHFPDQMAGVVMLDSSIHPPEHRWGGPPPRPAMHRIYATLPEALARFRLAPPQGCENLYIADYIARQSLRPVPLEDGTGQGWSWKFDPALWGNFEMPDLGGLLPKVACPMAVVWGERSKLMNPRTVEFMLDQLPDHIVTATIPDADHHVMIDQPIATVAALKGLLASWPRS